MAKSFFRKNNLTKNTLLKVATAGLFVVAVATSPYFLHQLVKNFFKEETVADIRRRTRKLRELERRKLIEFKELGDGTVKIILSHRGRELVRQYNLDDMKLQKTKKWDKKWRLIIYDIPITKKKAGDAFRNKMRSLGLYQLQKSIWVSPYDCLAEIEFLCGVFGIDMNESVFYFTTAEIPKERELKDFFNIK